MRKIKKIIFTFCLALFAGFSLAQAQDPNPEAFITVWETESDTLAYPGIGESYTLVLRDLTTNVTKEITVPSSSAVAPYVLRGLTPNVRYAIEVVPGSGTFTGFGQESAKPISERFNLKEITQWGMIQWAKTGLSNAFYGCANLELTAKDIPLFPEAATNLTAMFQNCTSLTGENSSIGDWDMTNVTIIRAIFRGATSFNQPLNWDVSKINNMIEAFWGTSSFNQDLGNWVMSGPAGKTNLNRMLDNSGMSPKNYAATLIGWAANPSTATNVPFTALNVCYDKSAADARAKLISMGWTITDAGVCTETSVELTDKASKFSLLKNPVQGNAYFIFEPSSDGTKIIIADLSGKLIVSKPIAEGASETSISLNHLPKGVYVALHQKAQGKQSVLKLIK